MQNSDKRLKYLDILAENYTFEYFPNKIETNVDLPGLNRSKSKQHYLSDDSEGNIHIFYPSIYNAGVHYSETKKGLNFYSRIRLAEPYDNFKYKSPSGSGIKIFIPQNTLNKIRNKESIESLHIVEGEFKSIYGDHFGLDIVGIPGIHMFIEKKGSKKLHPDIISIVQDCNVKNLNLIFDSDVRVVNFDFKNNSKKDYSQRLISFESAVLNFKLACFNYKSRLKKPKKDENESEEPCLNYFFTHIHEEFAEEAKGLDDLYEHVEDPESINNDLLKLEKASSYFTTKNLEKLTKRNLQEYFWLNTDHTGCPTNFYYHFFEFIQERPFYFFGNEYKGNEIGSLDILFHKELNEYIRVGVEYWREVTKTTAGLNRNNELIEIKKKGIVKWSKPEIREDYEKGKGIKNTFQLIKRYTGFTNIPGHDKDYKKIIDGLEYNLYHPTSHKLATGNWDNIKFFLEHISNNKYNNKYNLLLDLLCLKYTQPVQKLPITVLYSKEKGTGKSTFLWFLNEIFQDNAAIVSNKDIEDSFNEYLLSNVLLMDEVLINDKALEYIKSLSTTPITSINEKNLPRVKVAFFASFFMTTNRLTFVNIDEDENRFFILHVPPIDKSKLDPDLLPKMKEELPAFLHYLKHEHELTFATKKTRFWFPYEELETQALLELKKKSLKMALRAMKEWAKEMFFDHKILEFEATPKIIGPELRPYTTRDISFTEIKNTLTDDFNLKASKVHRFEFPKKESDLTEPGKLKTVWNKQYFDSKAKEYRNYIGATYTIKASDFLDDEELLNLKIEISDEV